MRFLLTHTHSVWRFFVLASLWVVPIVLVYDIYRPGFYFPLEEQLNDWRSRQQVSQEAEKRVTIVDIDETSLEAIGPWPWSRARLAELVETLLLDYQARAVALDMVLPEPADSEGDQRLAALAQYAPLVLATAFDFAPRTSPIQSGSPGMGWSFINPPQAEPATGYVGPHAKLAQSARCIGNIGIYPDADGRLRHLAPWVIWQQGYYPTLSLALLACAQQYSYQKEPAASGGDVLFSQWQFTVKEKAHWKIPYTRSPTAYNVIPAKEILSGKTPATLLKHNYVLVGSSSLGLSDRLSTPIAPLLTGVMVHAEAASALLDQQDGQKTSALPQVSSGMTVVFSLLSATGIAWLTMRMHVRWALAALMSGSLFWLLLWFYWPEPSYPPSPLVPIISYTVLLFFLIPFEWLLAHREAQKIYLKFRDYVPEEVLDALLRQDSQDVLAVRRREITVLFADIQGFTTLATIMPAENVAELTRNLLEKLTRCVLDTQGTLDKYMGDALMAFWGAPLAREDHADCAVEAAIAMQTEVQLFNLQRQSLDLPPLRVRIGIESGQAVVGDLGTRFRSAYTAIGDVVNVAERLQEAVRNQPCHIAMGVGAASRLTRHTAHALGSIPLRGRPGREPIYTVAQHIA